MSLTDDWKAGKLKDDDYYVRLTNDDIIIEHLCRGEWCFDYGWHNVIVEVLAHVPDYDHFVELTEKVEKLEKAFIKALQNNDELSAVITGNELEIDHLRQLLKECQTFFEEENPKDFTVLSERMEDLLTKIKEVLK